MKKILFSLLVFICFMNVNAQLLLKENFEYTPGTALELQPTWDWMSSQATLPIMIEAGAYSYTDYPASGGNKVVIGATGEDLYRTFPRQSSGSVYASFLVNVSAALTAGEYFVGFSANPISKTDYQGRIYVKRDASNKLAFGVTRTKSDRIGYSGFSYDMNMTYLIVLKYEIVSGVTNDVCSMTINPVIANGESGATWLTTTSADNSAETSNVVGAIALRQAAATTAVKVSGLRVAASWADLMDINANVSGLVLNTDDGLKTGFNASASSPSAAQSFKISGTGLSNDVVFTQNGSYFELSTDNIAYSDNITINQTAGTLTETTVYIRMKSNNTTGTNRSSTFNITSIGVNQTAVKATGNIVVEAVWNGTSWTGTTSVSNNAIINGNYSGPGFDCLDLIINAGKQTSITSGTLSVNGYMTLKSDAANGTATFIDNGGTLSVGANKTFVEQYLTSSRNWYISSPVSAATSNVFAASATKPMYYYVETTPNTWSQITNTSTTLDAKKGYIANINSDKVVTFNGGNLNTGAQTISDLTSGGATFTGFNLVGNPYPSYLNWSTTTKTNVSTSVWYRSKSTGTYLFQTYNASGEMATNGGTNQIPPMQAFWVKVISGTGSIGLASNNRQHLDQSIQSNRLKTPKAESRIVVRLQISNSINSDEALIYTDENALDTYDIYDSDKLFSNNPVVPEIYSLVQNEKLAINGYNSIKENQEILLGFKTSTANTFTIKSTEISNLPTNIKLFLVDKQQNNLEFDLTGGESYSFISDATNTGTRFSLIYRVANSTTDINDGLDLNTKIYTNTDNQIVITSRKGCSYQITTTLGQILKSGIISSDYTTINEIMQPGLYIVSLKDNKQELSSKIIVK